MRRYVVLEPAGRGRDSAPSSRAVFVRDGFSPFALFLPFLWLLRHRLFLAGLLALAVVVAVSILGTAFDLRLAAFLLALLLGILVALEGPSLRVARYRRRGYREAGIVYGASVDDAEIRYYAGKEMDIDRVQTPNIIQATDAMRPARPRPGNLLDPVRGR